MFFGFWWRRIKKYSGRKFILETLEIQKVMNKCEFIMEEPKIFAPFRKYALPESDALEQVRNQMKLTGYPYELLDVNNWVGYSGLAFFEASSIRKIGDTYYFIYSSKVQNELCYATSKSPVQGFIYRGVIISNCDVNINTYKPAEMMVAYTGNNHGGMELKWWLLILEIIMEVWNI